MSEQRGDQDGGTGPDNVQPPQNIQSPHQFPPGPGFPGGRPYPGFPAGGPYLPPTAPTNGLAIAGFVTAIVFWPAGLILSIAGLVRSSKIGRAGRGLAIAGIVLSVVLGGCSIALVLKIANSPAGDPGCKASKSAIATYQPILDTEERKLVNDEANNEVDVDSDIEYYANDLRVLLEALPGIATPGIHPSVKQAITTLEESLQANIALLQATMNADSNQIPLEPALATQLGADETALDNACSAL